MSKAITSMGNQFKSLKCLSKSIRINWTSCNFFRNLITIHCPSAYRPPAHLPIYPSTHLPICPCAHLPICPSAHLPIYPSAHLPMCPSAHLPICSYAHRPICTSAQLPIKINWVSIELIWKSIEIHFKSVKSHQNLLPFLWKLLTSCENLAKSIDIYSIYWKSIKIT